MVILNFEPPNISQKTPGIRADTSPKPHSLLVCEIWAAVPAEQRSARSILSQEFTAFSRDRRTAEMNEHASSVLLGKVRLAHTHTHLTAVCWLDYMLIHKITCSAVVWQTFPTLWVFITLMNPFRWTQNGNKSLECRFSQFLKTEAFCRDEAVRISKLSQFTLDSSLARTLLLFSCRLLAVFFRRVCVCVCTCWTSCWNTHSCSLWCSRTFRCCQIFSRRRWWWRTSCTTSRMQWTCDETQMLTVTCWISFCKYLS